MKKIFFAAAMACLALLVSCQESVPHTGDDTGALYGVWALKTKTDAVKNSDGTVTDNTVDHSNVHFYLTLSEFPLPHAIAKKGSFTDLDLDDVDVDGVLFTYNKDKKQISFKKQIWLSDDLLKYNMILSGTFDVVELTDKTLVLRQESSLLRTVTTYTYQRYK